MQNLNPWSKPVLRWAGSKRKMLPLLLQISKEANSDCYAEPFAGSACLFFALHPLKARISDLNPELIAFYHVLSRHPRKLWCAVNQWHQDEKTYYYVRSLNPSDLDPIKRAARFLYLNRFCFNGLYRANKEGNFNVPRGKNTGAIPTEQELYRSSVALRSAEILNVDFEESIRRSCRNTFFYLDPPYDYTGRIERGEYGPGSFKIKDLDRLQSTLELIESRGSKYLLSYLRTDEISKIEHGRYVRKVSVNRQIASFSRFRKPIEEVLISNFNHGC